MTAEVRSASLLITAYCMIYVTSSPAIENTSERVNQWLRLGQALMQGGLSLQNTGYNLAAFLSQHNS